jgi:hypothetical protein
LKINICGWGYYGSYICKNNNVQGSFMSALPVLLLKKYVNIVVLSVLLTRFAVVF